ncbi:hypothetical protein [Psychrobacter lutiphocae]|uniref:hypothetical protein n=1 Tax=Psychrobacter lutiphocae TaxID=540500 RepID=UPI0012EA4A71|nr:hypothetical protein [Psychrobacter lutiphocae]
MRFSPDCSGYTGVGHGDADCGERRCRGSSNDSRHVSPHAMSSADSSVKQDWLHQ